MNISCHTCLIVIFAKMQWSINNINIINEPLWNSIVVYIHLTLNEVFFFKSRDIKMAAEPIYILELHLIVLLFDLSSRIFSALYSLPSTTRDVTLNRNFYAIFLSNFFATYFLFVLGEGI